MKTSFSWLWRMAWRDSRRSRKRLFWFMAAIGLGIAALVALNSFGDNLAQSINDQARELLGADLALTANKPADAKTATLLRGIGTERSDETQFASMAFFPKQQGTRLAQVRALTGGFPYYGLWDTQPANAAATFRQQRPTDRLALVDEALLLQFGANVGDSIRIGNVLFRVAGRVLKTPGQSALGSTVAPTVFIPATQLVNTGLVQLGSRITYKTYYKFAATTDVEAMVTKLRPRLETAGLNSDTVAERQKQAGRAFSDLTRFLSLVAFVALLLGCVGVASAVQVHVRQKVGAVAVLRTLGASGRQAFLIYLLQTTAMGFLGAAMGVLLGLGLQQFLPKILGNFLPVTVETALSGRAMAQGLLTGLTVAVLFALLPLLAIRRVSPLQTLRAAYDNADVPTRDPWRWAVWGGILLFVGGFSYWQIRDWRLAVAFTVGLGVAFGVLLGAARLLMWAVRRFLPVRWSYVWRQGLANLYRPNNQTLTLVVSVGLGAFLIATLSLVQGLLLGQVALSGSGNQPNMVLFDIQPQQRPGVVSLLERQKLPVLQQVPVVTMRLSALNGRSVDALRKDTVSGRPDWVLNREYRVTYRDTLISSEKLVAGKVQQLAGDVPLITIEDDFMKRAKLKLGDTLTFDVQGLPLTTRIGGTRKIEWNRVQTNFLLVFPNGTLEQAPQFAVVMTRVNDARQSATFQRALVGQFPNVSAIDLGLVLKTLDEILDQIAFVIRFMALFSVLTGLLVLGGSVVISRYQRIAESVLLRTLGASRGQLLRITLAEYGLLGGLAALAGVGLSTAAAFLLAKFVFEVPFTADWTTLGTVAATVTFLTVLIGLLNSRDVITRPPLEVLRAE